MKFIGRCLAAAVFSSCLFSVGEASPISLHVVDGDVRAVLSSTASLGGLGLVMDESVRGTVTVDIDEAEPEEVVARIAAAKDLILEKQDGIFLLTALRQGMYRPYAFPVRYADLSTAREAVALSLARDRREDSRAEKTKEKDGARLSPEGEERVLADPGTGQLLLFGTAAEAAAARAIIAALDQPIRQVSLEAKVIAIQKDAAKKLGIEWAWSKVPQYPNRRVDYETRRRTVQNPGGGYTTVTEDWPKVTTERNWRSGESVPGILQFGHGPEGHPFEFYFGATLNALITDGKAKVLARPNITTLQGREAVINIGGEVPVPTVSTTNATTTTSITYREAGIILRYTPWVNPDGKITATVHTEVSSPLYVEALRAYRFQKRSADTTVRLQDGETMVIGGLIGSEETRSLSKIPFLGDLPILGAFFRSVRTSKSESEIMIFLTAHILDDTDGADKTIGPDVSLGDTETAQEKAAGKAP
ncbi:MAG: type II secretion system protein GspD [Negativicutes bacterium]